MTARSECSLRHAASSEVVDHITSMFIELGVFCGVSTGDRIQRSAHRGFLHHRIPEAFTSSSIKRGKVSTTHHVQLFAWTCCRRRTSVRRVDGLSIGLGTSLRCNSAFIATQQLNPSPLLLPRPAGRQLPRKTPTELGRRQTSSRALAQV